MNDLLELAYGRALKAGERREGTIPVFGSNGQVGWHDKALVGGPGIVVGRKGNPGVVTWAPTDFFAIDTAFYVVLKPKCASLRFAFHALRLQDLGSLGADSAVPGLNRNLAYMSPQLLPSAAVLERFESFVKPIDVVLYSLSMASCTLAALRDALLPKLISGQLRVKSAEQVVEAVT